MKHSFYHKYYQGYSTYNTVVGKKLKTMRIYEGDYHILKATDRDWVLKKVICTALDLLYFALFILAGIRNVAGNITWYVSMAGAMSLVAGVYLTVGVVNLDISKRYLTEYEFGEYRQQIYAGSIMTTLFIVITVVSYIISIIMGDRSNLTAEIITVVMYVLSGCATAAIGLVEKQSKYVKKPAAKVRAMLHRKKLKKEAANPSKKKTPDDSKPNGPTL